MKSEKLTVPELVNQFGINERTARRWRAADDPKCYRHASGLSIPSGRATPSNYPPADDGQKRLCELIADRANNFRQFYFLCHPEHWEYSNLPANLSEIRQHLLTTIADAERSLELLVGMSAQPGSVTQWLTPNGADETTA